MIKTENTAEKKENAAGVCAAECAAEIKAGNSKANARNAQGARCGGGA